MYERLPPESILFLDIECVSGAPTLAEAPAALRGLWAAKAPRVLRVDDLDAAGVARAYVDRAAIFAEFGKVVCISVGILVGEPGAEVLRVKSFADGEEAAVLGGFAELLRDHPHLRYFCGHNIKEFDIPYIGRRMLVNRMTLPPALDLRGKKPWEAKHLLDTMDMWSFGDRKNYTSLKLLAALFGIASPKDDIDGSQVGRVFWDDGDLARIARYCERDVVATANVFLAMLGRDAIPEERVRVVGSAGDGSVEDGSATDRSAGDANDAGAASPPGAAPPQ